MSDIFLVPEARLDTLRATPAGRSGEGGYNYQRAYAVARLAAMRTGHALRGTSDYPKWLRYDWADDLDEVLDDDTVCFTQCKRVDDIGTPAKLAEVLTGFAPKWLWTPESQRERLRFRLVSCDRRFVQGYDKGRERTEVRAKFEAGLAVQPSQQSDRAKWQRDADAVGHEHLFEALWRSLDCAYVPHEPLADDPAGPLLPAERDALNHLLQHGHVIGQTQRDALAALRRLIHENLIIFDPSDRAETSRPDKRPATIEAADARVTLFAMGTEARNLPFQVVDRTHLAEARRIGRERFIFDAPEWRYVVHGEDAKLGFIERDQTESLKESVRSRLIAPLTRGSEKFSVLLATGEPGVGKSTLIRRVAAQLVEDGAVVVADAGHNLTHVVPGGVGAYINRLEDLARQGRPVLLILDDPLRAESEWIELLFQLNRPGIRLAAICATPSLLYEQHRHELRGLQALEFAVNSPSLGEKRAYARLCGRVVDERDELPDDFLLLAAEMEEGKPFSEVMRRVWETLNGGKGIGIDLAFDDLSWRVRAFWFVCALHRTGTPCPRPLLEAALDLSGGTGRLEVSTALAQLKAHGGWKIFRVAEPVNPQVGELLTIAHQKIAAVAWEVRPATWLDSVIDSRLAAASLREVLSLYYVAVAAGRSDGTSAVVNNGLAGELIRQWGKAAGGDETLDLRHLCTLVGNLTVAGVYEPTRSIAPVLRRRAKGHDGWLAAYALHLLSADNKLGRSFPDDIVLDPLIEEADFSISPRRSIRFFNALKDPSHRSILVSRLLSSLDGTLSWHLHPEALNWLLSHANPVDIVDRLGKIEGWMAANIDSAIAWVTFLVSVQQLPEDERFDRLRERAATKAREWLDSEDNLHDNYVRTQFLTFVRKLPGKTRFDELRREVAVETRNWLAMAEHVDDSAVRTQFLVFILALQKCERFDLLRKDVAEDTALWLASHANDTVVRTQFLDFLHKLPSEFHDMRKRAAQDTAEWLRAHPDSFDVLMRYLKFLLNLRDSDLVELESESVAYHRAIIAKNPDIVGHRFNFGEQLLRLKNFEEAKTQYERVLEKEPGHQMAQRGLAIALQSLGETYAAEAAFKLALHFAKQKRGYLAIFHTSLGIFYLEQERWEEAIASFEEARTEVPDHFGNHLGIAKAQRGLGRLSDALDSLRRARAAPGLRSPAKEDIEQLFVEISQQYRGIDKEPR